MNVGIGAADIDADITARNGEAAQIQFYIIGGNHDSIETGHEIGREIIGTGIGDGERRGRDGGARLDL